MGTEKNIDLVCVEMSRRQNRIVTEYPSTAAEERALIEALHMLDDYEDSVEHSGAGFTGPEDRGMTELWGSDWRVHVIHVTVPA
ncbi:MAG: hypothetical protein KGL39_35900 [Patescibacteria group bacterium]|nr:hypothetical protein [Patescibacteria group bacterium]